MIESKQQPGTTNNRPIFDGLTEEQAQQLAVTAGKAGLSPEELEIFINEKIPNIINAFSEAIPIFVNTLRESINGIVRFARHFGIGMEEHMKSVATTKEWHLMNHAKKARTRKKYRDRLIRRVTESGVIM